MADPAEELSTTEYLVLSVLASNPSFRLYTPQIIADNTPADGSTVNEILKDFEEVGLVAKPRRGKYQLTSKGRAYLAGDLNASELSEEGSEDE